MVESVKASEMVPNFWEHIATQDLKDEGRLSPGFSELSKSDFERIAVLLQKLSSKLDSWGGDHDFSKMLTLLETVGAKFDTIVSKPDMLPGMEEGGKTCYGCGYCRCGGRGEEPGYAYLPTSSNEDKAVAPPKGNPDGEGDYREVIEGRLVSCLL